MCLEKLKKCPDIFSQFREIISKYPVYISCNPSRTGFWGTEILMGLFLLLIEPIHQSDDLKLMVLPIIIEIFYPLNDIVLVDHNKNPIFE